MTRITSPPQECAASAQPLADLLVGIPLVAVTVGDERVGIAAAGLYALAYTVELGVGLAAYFGAEPKKV